MLRGRVKKGGEREGGRKKGREEKGRGGEREKKLYLVHYDYLFIGVSYLKQMSGKMC